MIDYAPKYFLVNGKPFEHSITWESYFFDLSRPEEDPDVEPIPHEDHMSLVLDSVADINHSLREIFKVYPKSYLEYSNWYLLRHPAPPRNSYHDHVMWIACSILSTTKVVQKDLVFTEVINPFTLNIIAINRLLVRNMDHS